MRPKRERAPPQQFLAGPASGKVADPQAPDAEAQLRAAEQEAAAKKETRVEPDLSVPAGDPLARLTHGRLLEFCQMHELTVDPATERDELAAALAAHVQSRSAWHGGPLFEVGAPCRAVYPPTGGLYEAKVTAIIEGYGYIIDWDDDTESYRKRPAHEVVAPLAETAYAVPDDDEPVARKRPKPAAESQAAASRTSSAGSAASRTSSASSTSSAGVRQKSISARYAMNHAVLEDEQIEDGFYDPGRSKTEPPSLSELRKQPVREGREVVVVDSRRDPQLVAFLERALAAVAHANSER